MIEQAEIENWVIRQFAELGNYGFSQCVIKRDDVYTVVDWLGENIAIEMELDWREVDVFLLIVRLEDGKLPQGYYVSNGKPCRFHLQKIIKEKEWSVELDELKIISSTGKKKQSQKSSQENLKRRIIAYKTVLISCIDQLLDTSQTLFTK